MAVVPPALVVELVVVVGAPVLVVELPLPVVDPLLAEAPPSAMVVVPWAAASVKSAWIVSEIVPLAAVAVR